MIPGYLGTIWEGGAFKGVLSFSEGYPAEPPTFTFTPAMFHPNVYPNGRVCITTLNAEQGWRSDFSVAEILVSIQALLNNPNPSSPAQLEAVILFTEDRAEYISRVKAMVAKFPCEN